MKLPWQNPAWEADCDSDAAIRALRREFTVTTDLDGKGFNAQMKAAGKSGARVLVIFGEDEWQRGEVVVKHLTTGEQTTVAKDALVEALRARLGGAEGRDATR